MMLSLTEEEMLQRWRLLTMLEPMAPAGAIIERSDYTSLRELCLFRMRAWYIDLLDAADPSLVPVSDIRSSCDMALVRGQWELSLPEGTRRVLSVQLAGWPAPVVPRSPAEASTTSNPYLTGASGTPEVIRTAPDKLVIRGPVTDSPALAGSVFATTLPADGTYILSEKALALITPHLIP